MVVDDTGHPQFDDSEWPWVVNQTFPRPFPDACKAVPDEEVCIMINMNVSDSVINRDLIVVFLEFLNSIVPVKDVVMMQVQRYIISIHLHSSWEMLYICILEQYTYTV